MSREIKTQDERIEMAEGGVILAYIDFPLVSSGIHEITHTYVDSSLRGQGVAGMLMKQIIKKAQKEGFRLKPTCSYAVHYFETHPELADLKA